MVRCLQCGDYALGPAAHLAASEWISQNNPNTARTQAVTAACISQLCESLTLSVEARDAVQRAVTAAVQEVLPMEDT